MPQIVPGKTTKEEVFLLIGEPDDVSPDERRLTYRWTKVRAILVIGGYGAGAVGSFEKESEFVVDIGDNGVVSGKKVENRYKTGK